MKKEVPPHNWTRSELEKMEAEPEKYEAELAEVNEYWGLIQRELLLLSKLPEQVALEAQLQAAEAFKWTLEASQLQAAEAVNLSLGASQRAAAYMMEVMSKSKLYQLYVANREALHSVMPELKDMDIEEAVQVLSNYRKYLACKARSAPRKPPTSRYASEYEEWLKVANSALKGCQAPTSAGRKRVAIRAIEQTETMATRRTISVFVRDHWSEINPTSHADNP